MRWGNESGGGFPFTDDATVRRGRVHGLDRLHAEVRGGGVGVGHREEGRRGRPGFTLRGEEDEREGAAEMACPAETGRLPRHPGRHRRGHVAGKGCPPELLEMFGGAVSPEVVEGVFVECGGSVDAAVEALLGLSIGADESVDPCAGKVQCTEGAGGSSSRGTARDGRSPVSAPLGAETEGGPDLWDALPGEVRLLILVGPTARALDHAARNRRAIGLLPRRPVNPCESTDPSRCRSPR